MTDALLGEDRRVMAAGLAHELTHASDFDLIAVGLLERDCAELEARAFEAQAKITRASWSEELLTATDWEKGPTITVLAYESGGLDEYKVRVLAPVLREACHVNRSGFRGHRSDSCSVRPWRPEAHDEIHSGLAQRKRDHAVHGV